MLENYLLSRAYEWFTAFLLPAQISELPLPDVGNLTATAILGWYAWHTASRTIPALFKHFREEMASSRAECRVERDLLREEIAAERRQRSADNQAVIKALQELTQRLPAKHQRGPHGGRGVSETSRAHTGDPR